MSEHLPSRGVRRAYAAFEIGCKVVFDTVIFVRGLINPHGKWGRLVFAHSEGYELIISEPIATEILEVLHRPELRSKFRSLESLDVAAVIALLGQSAAVDVLFVPPVSRDPKDDKFLATTAAARA